MPPSPKTVGRGSALPLHSDQAWLSQQVGPVQLNMGDSAVLCAQWPSPTVIVSDGAYGVLGFDGDTAHARDLAEWYAPHVAAWAKRATGRTTLWFWNTEVGWAQVHPVLEAAGFRYVSANIWDKGKAHMAGNVNTQTIRRFPVVSEICVQYAFEHRPDGLSEAQWLLREWKRTGLPLRAANLACGVKDVATRKYLDQGHLWYRPPSEAFAGLVAHANTHGHPEGRPYFPDPATGQPMTTAAWMAQRAVFHCPMGWSNVWHRPPLKGPERIKWGNKALHLNQKPLDLMRLIIAASSEVEEVVWEPFGGLCSASVAAGELGRRAYAGERHGAYVQAALTRLQARWPA